MNRFIVKGCLMQEKGNNLCGDYVCEHLMQYSLKTSEEYLKVHKQYTHFVYYYLLDVILYMLSKPSIFIYAY